MTTMTTMTTLLKPTIRTRAGEALSLAGFLILVISLAMLLWTLGFAVELHPIVFEFAGSPTIWLAGIVFSFLIMGLGEAVTILNHIRSATVTSIARERLHGS